MDAHEIARVLDDIGRLLAFRGDNPFKVRAYRNAAQTLRRLEEPLGALIAEGRLRELPGVGEAIAAKVVQLHETGTVPLYERLTSEVPVGVLDLVAVPGLGATRARAAFETLGVASLDDLEAAAASGALARVPGFGDKTVRSVLAGLARVREYAGRHLAVEARPAAALLVHRLESHEAVERAAVAGALRRRLEVVSEIRLVAASEDPEAALDAFVVHPTVAGVLDRHAVEEGAATATARLAGGLQARLGVVPPAQFAAALLHATGSRGHVERLRERAAAGGLRLRPEGLRGEAGGPLEALDEVDLYAALGLGWIPPELREDSGEVEAAAAGRLPDLVELADLRGVLHCHTDWSDGRASIARMAEATVERGFEYVAICDHSRSAAYAGGLSPEDLARQREEIEAANAAVEGVAVLAGAEVDVLADGSLDYPDEVLASLEFVVASVHSHFGLPAADQTARIVRALANPWVDVLGHPTGRLLLRREGYAVDVERILDAAAEHGVALEVNADPRRLDLDWRWHRAALERGVKLAIAPDAHGLEAIDYVALGVDAARKGWATAGDVLNALPLDDFRTALRRNRA